MEQPKSKKKYTAIVILSVILEAVLALIAIRYPLPIALLAAITAIVLFGMGRKFEGIKRLDYTITGISSLALFIYSVLIIFFT